MIKKLIALVLGVGLLAGCAAPGAVATPETAVALPATTAAPQTLTISCGNLGCTDTAAGRALQLYAEQNGVQLAYTYEDAAADLAVVYAGDAADGSYRDLSADPLLAAAATRAGLDAAQPIYALPAGRSLYAYWADKNLLEALLGENAVPDLQNASWEEWSAFIEALTAWLAQPAQTTVTLSGSEHTLPAEKPELATALVGALYAPDAVLYAGNAQRLTPALLAAGDTRTADALTGPLNGAFAALALETQNQGYANNDTEDAFTAGAVQGLREGKTLFVRLPLANVVTNMGAEACADLVPIPVKTALDETDLTTTEYNLAGLMNYPVLVSAGSWAIPATASETGARAAANALLWLYASAEGEAVLTDQLALVTPWGTASDNTAVGAMQVGWVSTGILPEVTLTKEQTIALNEINKTAQDAASWDKAARDDWAAAVTAILAE